MKPTYLLLIVSALLISTVSQAQTPGKNDTKPGVTKGYYSIGDHAEKINVKLWRSPDAFVAPRVSKGYYSMGSNNQKLKARPVWFGKPYSKPVLSKGYYSIESKNGKPDTTR
ncbi:MAG TPA: hypothetical protein VEZ17_14800 [Chitinophagaceae bacterium]|jgi:hypothetical protein|nr:hypothetical protein [Chitinophagaceae bacterium]